MVAHDAAVERETAALSAAIGDPVSNSSDESKLCIFESFLVVHYMGAHSVKPEANGSRLCVVALADLVQLYGATFASHNDEQKPATETSSMALVSSNHVVVRRVMGCARSSGNDKGLQDNVAALLVQSLLHAWNIAPGASCRDP